jgi:hypothetical protein
MRESVATKWPIMYICIVYMGNKVDNEGTKREWRERGKRYRPIRGSRVIMIHKEGGDQRRGRGRGFNCLVG